MLIDERFILLFLDLYLNRTIANDGNNFQWKINVAMRGFCCFFMCRSALLFLLCSSARLLGTAFFFLLFIYSNVPSALLSFFLLFLPSFLPLSALLFLLCSAALLDGGAYPFAEKPKYHFLPPKIPAIFSKKRLPPSYI